MSIPIIEDLKLRFMHKPTFYEIVNSDNDPKVIAFLTAVMNKAGRDQNKIFKKAAKIK